MDVAGGLDRDGRAYLEAAIRNRAFSLVYQPIVHLDTASLSGVEALCRPYDGRPADAWFARCRQLGLAEAMDFAVVEMALDEVDALPADCYLSINLSLATLSRSEALRDLLEQADHHRQLVVELTEHVVVRDYEVVRRELDLLRDAGVLLAVDDAGAGYSSFRHILRLRPEIIKLDRSITEAIDRDPARRALAMALVIFAGQFGANVVAEGIETEGELLALRAAGVARGQGYWLGAPRHLPLGAIDYQPVPYIDLVQDAAAFASHAGLGTPLEFRADATVAVVAHGLLSSLASIASAVTLLSEPDERMSADQHRALGGVVQRQIAHVTAVLSDLVRGLPPETIRALDELSRSAFE